MGFSGTDIETRVLDLAAVDLLDLLGAEREIVTTAADVLVREISSPLIVSLAGSNS